MSITLTKPTATKNKISFGAEDASDIDMRADLEAKRYNRWLWGEEKTYYNREISSTIPYEPPVSSLLKPLNSLDTIDKYVAVGLVCVAGISLIISIFSIFNHDALTFKFFLTTSVVCFIIQLLHRVDA